MDAKDFVKHLEHCEACRTGKDCPVFDAMGLPTVERLKARENIDKQMGVVMLPIAWIGIHSLIGVALRHPSVDGASKYIAYGFLKGLGDAFVERGIWTESERIAYDAIEAAGLEQTQEFVEKLRKKREAENAATG